jgi:predicted aconitase
MRLNDEHKRMLQGECGEPARVAMEMLNTLGTIYDAEDLVPVASAHCAGLSLKSHGVAGMEWAEDMARGGARVVIPTTMNVIGVDRSRDLGLPAEWVEHQMRIEKAYEAMGCIGTSSCVPYFSGFLPHFNEHVAWAESSAVVFLNSIVGARDNREGGPSAWASGITGYTPRYGLHLDENRRGEIIFDIQTKLEGLADYGALGNYVGKMVGTRIPVFLNLGAPSIEDLVAFGSALASSGGVAMFHAVGITPEATTLSAATGGKDCERVIIGQDEIYQGYRNLSSSSGGPVDYVAIGCPHCTLNQIAEIAHMLEGRRVHEGTALWVHTNIPIKRMAEQYGYLKAIEDAGGVLTQDLCTILGNPEALGFRSLATNSPKMAFYAPGSNKMTVNYGTTENCIRAALDGVWPGNAWQ